MHVQLPHNITDLSLTFFAKGRPFEVQKSNAHFATIRTMLLDWNNSERGIVDIDYLISLADPTVELRAASGERLTFAGREMRYDGHPLHNLWVDKILAFKGEGENFDPIFRALEDLQLNPTPAARERLPIFVERSKLGFLPDGRIAAFKGVRDNYNDVHSNTVNYAVGKTVSMPRHECNANPDQTCTTGLHLGAIDYIRNNGYGWGSDRRMLLCAFWPRHVVAVPTDYHGGKMRVEELTVLDEVDRKYVNDLLNSSSTLVRGYDTPASTPAPATVAEAKPEVDVREPYQKAKVGDWIEVEDDQYLSDGEYLVVAVDDTSTDNQRLSVKTGTSDTEWVDDAAVTEILATAPDWYRAKLGDWIEFSEYGETKLGEVIEIDDSAMGPGSDSRLRIHDGSDETWVDNEDVEKLLDAPPAVYLRARMDDLVTIADNPVLRDGEFKVVEIFSDGSVDGENDARLGVEINDEPFPITNRTVQSIKREVEAAVAKGAAAAAASTAVVVVDAAVPVVENLWEQVRQGDKIRIANEGEVKDGEYEVSETDHALRHGPDGVGIRVKNGSLYGAWIYNKAVTAIVERDGKPFGVPAVTDAVPADGFVPVDTSKKAHEQVEIGGFARVTDGAYSTAGEYEVLKIDRGDRLSILLRKPKSDSNGDLWVYDTDVTHIRKKDFVAAPADLFVPVDTTKKLLDQASVGDFARVKTGYYSEAGEYEILKIANSRDTGMSLYLKEPTKQAGTDLWVMNSDVTHIRKANAVTAPATPVADTRPLYLQAEIGDRIRVDAAFDTDAGEYEVTKVDGSGNFRVSVDNQGKNGRVWWVGNDSIKAIVRKGPATASTEPAWKLAKAGDVVSVKGSSYHKDGEYRVDEVDEGNGLDKRLKLFNPGGTKWVRNEYVTAIVGKTEPAKVMTWKDARTGDTVRIEDHDSIDDGEYKVVDFDASDDDLPVRIEMPDGAWRWMFAKNIKAVTKKAA